MIGLTGDWPATVEIVPGAILVIDLIAQSQHPLLEEEEFLATDATVARMRELCAGRTVARRAMTQSGIQTGAILVGTGGEPIWPVGVCGSLTHTPSHIGAFVARRDLYLSLGVDLDDRRCLGPKVAAEIAVPEELELIRRLDQSADASSPGPENAVFCAKEAIFKCQYNITQWSDIEFGDVLVREGEPTGCLKAYASEQLPTLVRQAVGGISVKLINIQGLRVACAFMFRGKSSV